MVHFITIHKRLIALLSLLMMAAIRVSAVPVHINSGNPAYPFPQFLEYACGGNLGTRNAEGVVHAEMEQDIRDAYQIHANEFEYTGESYKGVKYIWTPDKQAYDCTEGDGYALLASAYMADLVTFNGIWMCTHDKRRVRTKTYSGCQDNTSGYIYGPYAIGDDAKRRGQTNYNTAADGDVDVALALYVAYKQWGEFMRDVDGNIINDACGNPISLKQELINVVRGLVAISMPSSFISGDHVDETKQARVYSGIIGLDGYPKGGDTWGEQTTWASTNPIVESPLSIMLLPEGEMKDVSGYEIRPDQGSAPEQHIDYNAPAFFREFRELLHELAQEGSIASNEWEEEQFRRAEASSDWLVNELTKKSEHTVLQAGWCTVSDDGSQTTFRNFNDGEDWRCPMRQILNYVWHGNPEYTWNPKTHKVEEGGNTFEYDAGVRLSKFFNDPASWNPAAGSECVSYPAGALPYGGPNAIFWIYDPMTGVLSGNDGFVLNRVPGGGASAPVAAQDYELMGLIYRTCDVVWDNKTNAPAGAPYTAGTPKYMHGWARHYGMMVLTGNFPAPGQMNPSANMKIYRAIKDSVTFAYTGDEITYLLDYRNYGSIDAEGVMIVENVPKDFEVISVSDNGKYDASSHTITWDIGKVSGYHSDGTEEGCELNWSKANLKATVGQVSYKVRIGPNAAGRYCTTAEISCKNGTGWVSNEYPNYITATMQRNCVDVYKRALKIEKTVDKPQINPDNVATFSINFENSSEIGWVDGGRPRVNVSYALRSGDANSTAYNSMNQMNLQFRLYNDAIEPYINYGNYRISYYLYDPTITCLSGADGCNSGWGITNGDIQGGDPNTIKVTHENIVEGVDSVTGRRWNQRLSIQFPQELISYYTHVNRYKSNLYIHKGGVFPFKGNWRMYNSAYMNVDWTDDWSFDTKYMAAEASEYYPITPSVQRLDENGKSIPEDIDRWLTCGCTKSNVTVSNILVEEYDGYVWRRVLGSGPMPGIEFNKVYIRDTLPLGTEFVSFVGECPLGNGEDDFGATWRNYKAPNGQDIVEWTIPKIQVNQKGTIKYLANVTFPSGASCQTNDEDIINKAWISAEKCSPIYDTALITVTCAKVPDPIIPTTLTKIADKDSYEVGDDISYTIGYKQTHGAVFDDAVKDKNNWTLSGATATGSTLTVGAGNSAKHNMSYAKNSYTEITCDLAYYEHGVISLRDNIKIDIKQDYATLDLVCTDGSQTKSVSIVHDPAEFTVKILLNDDVLKLWINKDTSKSANVTIDNLRTLSAGYFGLGSNGGSHKFSNIHIHTDYAYDLSIVDLVPAEVEVDESSFQSFHNGSAAGTGKLLKGADEDSIVWTGLANNPIAFGDTFTVTWKGTVKECSEKIINLAKAKLLGHAHNKIMAQAVSGCGEECPLPNVTLVISDDTICAGTGSAQLTAGPVGNYKYQFFENGQPITEETSNNVFVVNPISAGTFKYTANVVSGSTQLPCYSPSDSVILVVEKLPVATDYDLGTFCVGNADVSALESEVNSMQSKGVTYSWFDSNGDPTTAPDVNSITEAGDYLFSYSLTTESGCESRKMGTLKFTVKRITAPTGTFSVAYLLGDTASNGKFNKNLIQQDPAVVDVESDYTYIWYDENYQPLQSVPIPDVPAGGSTVTTVYHVNRTQPVGCVSDTVDVTVVVSGSSVPVPNHVTYCLNETAQPISATVSEVKDSNASWEVVYYDADGNELSTESDRTPNTSVAGDVTYYVSQREVGNPTNESGKVPLMVTIVEVPSPDISMNRTQYCKGDEYEQLQVKSSSLTLDAKKSSFSWSVDGKSVTGVPLAQTQTEVVQYGVVESYEIESGRFCVSDTAKFAVKTTFVPVATGSLSVNYLKEEAGADGSFESILTKDPSTVSASDNSDYELVWYDADLNELGTTDPSPKKDNAWKENEDVKLTYFVKQRHKDSGCLSDTVRVTVIMSDALVPNTFPMNYCHHAKASSLEHSASINTNKGQVKDIDYELVWFSPGDNYSTPSDDAPVPSTENVGETIYKVAQKRKADGSVSSMADVKVTVFPNPEIKVDALPQTCGEEIEITKYVYLANSADTSTMGYFSDKNCKNPLSELTLTGSTLFYANAYYTIFSQPNIVGVCASDTLEINATVDDLSNLVVDAPSSVCPNGDIHLKASATSTTSTVSYEWSGAATGSADVLDTKDESGVFGKVYSYSLTASAGACHLDTTVSVTVGKGELTGDVLANNQVTHNIKICEGEPVELSTTHEGQDYKWSDLSGGIVASDKDVSVTPTTTTTYVLSFVNKCETSDTVVVEVYPLSLTADFTLLDTSICEKSSASAVLTINGYDPSMSGSYIKWMKNGNELSEYAGQTTLQLDNVDKDDSGEYTYEVSNGICLAKTSDVKTTAQLEVKPYVSFAEPTTVLVPHGGSADLSISGLSPSDATVAWKGDLHTGDGNPFTVDDMATDELFAVTLSANGYCDSETEVQVLVDAKAVVSISVSADAACVEDGVIVSADTTGTGHLLYPEKYQLTWYSLDGEANLSKLSGEGLSIHDYPQASASYFAVVTYGNQEAVSDTLAVEIVSPAAYTMTENAVSCSGDEVTIEVSSEEENVEVEWTEDGTKASSIVVAPTETRSYAFVISKKGLCPVTDQILVSVKEKPTVTMDEEKTVCEGSDIIISPTVTGKEYSGFVWTNPDGDIISRELKLITAPTLSGDYTLLVETSSCGDASASVNVKVIPTPVLYIDSLDFTTRKIEVASGGSGAFEYKMDKEEWQNDNLYEGLAYKVLHTAYARDEMGCVGVTVFSIAQPPVPIPEYFTPDGSGQNEVWDVAPILEAYPKTTVKIFDRTGKVVAELDGSTSDWDGTYNGTPLPSTDYWYIINVPEIRQQFTGHFTLLRGK